MGELVLGSWNGDLLLLGMICESVITGYAFGSEIYGIGCTTVETQIVLGLA